MDFLLAEMQKKLSTEYIDRIKQYSLPEELDKVNREFFIYSSNKGFAYETHRNAPKFIYGDIRCI